MPYPSAPATKKTRRSVTFTSEQAPLSRRYTELCPHRSVAEEASASQTRSAAFSLFACSAVRIQGSLLSSFAVLVDFLWWFFFFFFASPPLSQPALCESARGDTRSTHWSSSLIIHHHHPSFPNNPRSIDRQSLLLGHFFHLSYVAYSQNRSLCSL